MRHFNTSSERYSQLEGIEHRVKMENPDGRTQLTWINVQASWKPTLRNHATIYFRKKIVRSTLSHSQTSVKTLIKIIAVTLQTINVLQLCQGIMVRDTML